MSLNTRCNHCQTVFRITLEQLQAHGGRVRCGRCLQVFNGVEALVPDTDLSAAAAAATESSAQPSAAEMQPAVPAPEVAPAAQPASGGDADVAGAVAATAEASESNPSDTTLQSVAPPHDILPELEGPEPEQPAGAIVVPEHDAATETEQPPAAAMAEDNPFAQDISDDEPEKTRHPVLVAASVLLASVLLAQALYFSRGEISARHPLARQWLTDACAWAGCVVSLPQKPKAVLIEASDLQVVDPAQPNRIQLTATLRNHAGHDVAYPALDLVLTNVNDHTLVRRIFLPAEYLSAGRNPDAGISANAELTVRLAMETGTLGAAGFRLAVLPAP